ncbi:hypothetical protein GCM10020358_10900 [Amorphoplanes nipponensis]|uniref:Uncharacterized protein n=1 Tax=Actinoplanes nipponensis TaxID=135950 RepID=A0A919JMC7_9ACTN|nr:hypothetical protein Ani05nite_58320 [Actinoplanes nipponensis]
MKALGRVATVRLVAPAAAARRAAAGRLPDRMPLVVRVAGNRRGSIRVAAVSRVRVGRAAVRLPGRPAAPVGRRDGP